MAVHDLDRNLKRAGGGVLEVLPDSVRLSVTWLKADLSIPKTAIHSVVLVDPSAPDPFDGHAFQRVPRVLRLNTALTQKAAIAIVFSEPFLVDGFKYGSERGLPISATERKRGVLADVLVLDMPTATAAANAVDDIGARRSPNLALALSPLIPSATDSERAAHARKGRKATAWIVTLMLLQLTIVVGVLSVRLQSVQGDQQIEWSVVVRNVVISWAAVAVGFALGTAFGPLKAKALAFAPLAALALLPLLFISSARSVGAIAVAAFSGVLIGWSLRALLGPSKATDG